MRDNEFSTLEFIFNDEETVIAVSTSTIESEQWTFFPIHRGKRSMNISLGAITPPVKPEWILTAVFNEIDEDFNMLTVEKTDTLNFVGYGIEA